MVQISIVIPTYNRGEKLLRTLGSLAAQTLPVSGWELIVVDNNSADDTPRRFAAFAASHPEINARIVREERQGVAWARNRGVAEAKGRIISMIDDDETVNPGFLEAYCSFFDAHPEVNVAGGRVLPLYECTKPAWMSPYTERPIAWTIDMGDRAKPFRKGYPGTGNMGVRREVFDRYGVFDTGLGRKGDVLTGGEDKDFFLRLAGAGESVWYVPDAIVSHIISAGKTNTKYFRRLAFGCGASERIRTRSVSKGAYMLAIVKEMFKWGGSFLIFLWYTLCQEPLKAHYLMVMRRCITAGLLSGKTGRKC